MNISDTKTCRDIVHRHFCVHGDVKRAFSPLDDIFSGRNDKK